MNTEQNPTPIAGLQAESTRCARSCRETQNC